MASRVAVSILPLLLTAACAAPEESVEGAAGAIYGGRAELGYPATVLVRTAGMSCSGVLVRPEAVVTAAHCVQKLGPLADISLRYRDPRTREVRFRWGYARARDVFDHPEYEFDLSHDRVRNDIAVIKLHPRATTIDPDNIWASLLIGPITDVPPARIVRPHVGCDYRAVGYGTTNVRNPDGSEMGTSVDRRRSARQCVRSFGRGVITVRGSGGQICHGDSGGPHYEEGTRNAIGINSTIRFNDDGRACTRDDDVTLMSLWAHRGFIRCAVAVNTQRRLRHCMTAETDPASDWARGSTGSESTGGDGSAPEDEACPECGVEPFVRAADENWASADQITRDPTPMGEGTAGPDDPWIVTDGEEPPDWFTECGESGSGTGSGSDSGTGSGSGSDSGSGSGSGSGDDHDCGPGPGWEADEGTGSGTGSGSG